MHVGLRNLPRGIHHPPPNPGLDARARVEMVAQVERHRQGHSRWMSLEQGDDTTLWIPLHGSIVLRDRTHGERVCHPGSIMLLTRPWSGEYQNRATGGRFRNCWARLSGSAVRDLAEGVTEHHGPIVDLGAHPAAQAAIVEWLRQGLRAHPPSASWLAAQALSFLGLLCAAPASSGVIERALQLIDAELTDPDLTVGRLATALGCATSTFTRRFHSAVGTPPYQYILRRRVDRARELLFGDEPIAVIGQRCGYRDAAHFVHSFRRGMGTSPGRYRREIQQQGG